MAYTVTAYSGDKITVGSVVSRNEYTTNVDAGMRGDTGYSGSLGYTGSQGVGYTGSQGVSGYTGSMGSANTETIFSTTLNINRIIEPVQTYTPITQTINHDSLQGHNLVILYPTSHLFINLYNLNLEVGKKTELNSTIFQGPNNSFMVYSVLIENTLQPTYWEDGTFPTGNPGSLNDIKFDIFRADSNTYIIKASSKNFDIV